MARETYRVQLDGLDHILASITDIDVRTLERARKLHRKACMQGRARGIWSSLAGVERLLLDLNNLRQASTLLDWGYAGMQVIDIDRVVGSEGYCDAFDRGFYPLPGHDVQRWLQAAASALTDTAQAPVEIVQVDSSYYAQTGQYQISVARALGRKQIAAFVTGWDI